jgi:hypothetical protein
MDVSHNLVLETSKDTTLLDIVEFLKGSGIRRIERVPVSNHEDMENVQSKIEIEDNNGNIDYIYQQWAGECGDTM